MVDRCKSLEEAINAAETESEWILNYGVYDYGGPVEAELDEDSYSPPMQGGTPKYRKGVAACLRTERHAMQEHWDVLRQAMSHFGRRKKPPRAEALFKASYKQGVGILPVIKPGQQMYTTEPFSQALWRAKQLLELLEGRPNMNRLLYDHRVNQSVPVAKETRKNVYAVPCDFHC